MEKSTLSFEEGSVFEIWGNIAWNYEWKASEYGPPAYFGRIVVGKNGFFYGYYNELCVKFEAPIIGRFVKGRGETTHVLFCSFPASLDCRCWMKRQIGKPNYGVYDYGCGCNDVWGDFRLYDFFTFELKEHPTKDVEDREALANIIMAEYKRQIRHNEAFEIKADEFVDRFDYVWVSMSDLLIEGLENREAEIQFP